MLLLGVTTLPPQKLEWLSYLMLKTGRFNLYSSGQNTRMWRTDRQICRGYYSGMHCEQCGRAVKTAQHVCHSISLQKRVSYATVNGDSNYINSFPYIKHAADIFLTEFINHAANSSGHLKTKMLLYKLVADEDKWWVQRNYERNFLKLPVKCAKKHQQLGFEGKDQPVAMTINSSRLSTVSSNDKRQGHGVICPKTGSNSVTAAKNFLSLCWNFYTFEQLITYAFHYLFAGNGSTCQNTVRVILCRITRSLNWHQRFLVSFVSN